MPRELTVIVTRYLEPDDMVKECLQLLANQKGCVFTVIFLDQKKEKSIRAFCNNISDESIRIIHTHIPAKSLAFARNFGLKKAKTRYVGFCDVDCKLEKNWCKEMINAFHKSGAAIVGTKIIPNWHGKTSWFHKSRYIQEFYSLLDISEVLCDVPKVIGASFAVDKFKLGDQGYFDENLGRKDGNYLGGEETDLCQRVRSIGGRVVYTPFTVAHHQISRTRLPASWIQKRAFFGGLSRALRKGKAEPFNKTYRPLDFLAILFILPAYLYGYFVGRFKFKNV